MSQRDEKETRESREALRVVDEVCRLLDAAGVDESPDVLERVGWLVAARDAATDSLARGCEVVYTQHVARAERAEEALRAITGGIFMREARRWHDARVKWLNGHHGEQERIEDAAAGMHVGWYCLPYDVRHPEKEPQA